VIRGGTAANFTPRNAWRTSVETRGKQTSCLHALTGPVSGLTVDRLIAMSGLNPETIADLIAMAFR